LAEEAFDCVSAQAGSGILSTDSAEAALAKVMEKLTAAESADVEEARASVAEEFEKEKQKVVAKAEAAERQKAALAEQLARTSEMLAELTQSWELKIASSEEEVSVMARELGLDVSREDLQLYPSLRNLNQVDLFTCCIRGNTPLASTRIATISTTRLTVQASRIRTVTSLATILASGLSY
jgi:hypothetical protein